MKTLMAGRTFRTLILAACTASPLLAQPASAPTLAALNQVEQGQWQLRGSGGAASRSICVADPRALLQLQHVGATCSKFVIANDPRQATVHYTCPGAGHGRTTVRVETPRLIQIESQGVAKNEPFAVQMEGRRVGNCATRVGMLTR